MTRALSSRTGYVLWGYHRDYGPQPIKLAGAATARGLSRQQASRDRQGFLTHIYLFGTEPTGLRLMVQQRRAAEERAVTVALDDRIAAELTRIALVRRLPPAARAMFLSGRDGLKPEPTRHLRSILHHGTQPGARAAEVLYERMTGIPLPAAKEPAP